MTRTDWLAWHDAYSRPGSGLDERLSAVRGQISRHLDETAQSDVYLQSAPADLVLLCGIFGNISDEDVRRTIHAAPQLCGPGAEVIWTRHRNEPDLTPSIREWFADAGFDEVAFISPETDVWSVGVHRFVGPPAPLVPGQRWFTFFR